MTFTPLDSDHDFDDLDPLMLFGARASVQLGEGLSLGAGVRSSLSDPEADHLEASASLGWVWIAPVARPFPPVVRLGARVEVGWRWLELHGSDFVLNDDGLVVAARFEGGLVLMEGFALTAHLGTAGVMTSNRALDTFALTLRFGVEVVASF